MHVVRNAWTGVRRSQTEETNIIDVGKPLLIELVSRSLSLRIANVEAVGWMHTRPGQLSISNDYFTRRQNLSVYAPTNLDKAFFQVRLRDVGLTLFAVATFFLHCEQWV